MSALSAIAADRFNAAGWKIRTQIRENGAAYRLRVLNMSQPRELKRTKAPLVVAAAVAAILLGFFGFFRHGYDTTLMLADLAGLQTPLPDRRPAAGRSEIEYDADGGRRAADLYTPQGTAARAGLVLVPGAAEGGRRDPRLVEFAEILARSEFAVLVPDIASFRELRPSPDSIREIVDGVGQLRNGGALVAGLRLGIGAFSIASGPAVLAALDAPECCAADFLVLVGGYHDLPRTLTFLTAGYFEVDGEPRQREPDTYGKWIYALSNAGRLHDPADRAALAALARRKLDDPQAASGDLLAAMGPAGRTVYDFIDNRDPARVPRLLAALPSEVRADIESLDLAARDLSGLRAEFILVHGLDDAIIPYSESVALDAALPAGRSKLFLLEGLHHVDQELRGVDAWRMWRALRAVLAQRDRGPA
jgi:fermentation-respiration switch protein FrsA (DUF1100 family)